MKSSQKSTTCCCPVAAGFHQQPAEEVALRLAFDPEALPEHPGTQLASYGTPLVDRLSDRRRGPRSLHPTLPRRPEPQSRMI